MEPTTNFYAQSSTCSWFLSHPLVGSNPVSFWNKDDYNVSQCQFHPSPVRSYLFFLITRTTLVITIETLRAIVRLSCLTYSISSSGYVDHSFPSEVYYYDFQNYSHQNLEQSTISGWIVSDRFDVRFIFL